jgi:EAL domain-containing protein (putative c-di-GMP-specific phosphodiesterase class I)
VTETATIANIATAADFIREIKKLGCKFSLDDFGSGNASYQYLKNLPVDFIKIDGAFIKDIHTSKDDYALVKSMQEIAHLMGKWTIAEFVENDEIIAILREIGVDYLQGYGIHKPTPLSEIDFS